MVITIACMHAVVNAYLNTLRQIPGLLDITLGAALDELDRIASDPGQIERLSANVVFTGQAPFPRGEVRRLHALLKTHRDAATHRHRWFHRRYVYIQSRPFLAPFDKAAAWARHAEDLELPCGNTSLCELLEEVIGAMCSIPLAALKDSFDQLFSGGRFELGQPITRQSLSQGLAFALGPFWHGAAPVGLAAYIGHLYGDAMCTALEEIRYLVEREHEQLKHQRSSLSVSTNSGFNLTVPGNSTPRPSA